MKKYEVRTVTVESRNNDSLKTFNSKIDQDTELVASFVPKRKPAPAMLMYTAGQKRRHITACSCTFMTASSSRSTNTTMMATGLTGVTGSAMTFLATRKTERKTKKIINKQNKERTQEKGKKPAPCALSFWERLRMKKCVCVSLFFCGKPKKAKNFRRSSHSFCR